MRTPAELDMYAREIQHDYRAEAAGEALARRLAPGPLDRLLAALRARKAMPVTASPPAVAPRPLPTTDAPPKKAA